MAKQSAAPKHAADEHEPSTTANPKIAAILLLLGLAAGLATALGLEHLAQDRIAHPVTAPAPAKS
jgi:hypothetical protein